MDYMEDIDLNVERARITRRKMTSLMAQYKQLIFEKRRDASQAKLDAFFRRPLLDEPHPGALWSERNCSDPMSFILPLS